MIKHYIITLSAILTLCNVANAQSTYNQELEKAAKEISQKIITSGKNSVAVLDFENSNKQISELGNWLAGIFTTHLENNSNNVFVVKNRTDIEKAIQQIKSENGSGAFDSKTIQRLGEISGSDVIVYGEITLLDNDITVNIRTKNISLNSTIGGVIVTFLATEGMKTKYDNYLETKTSSITKTNTSTGVSGEGTARTSKNPNCKVQNTGDYCFQNDTKFELKVTFRCGIPEDPNGWSQGGTCTYTLTPGQKQCFYNVPAGAANYSIEPAVFQYSLGGGTNVNYGTNTEYGGTNNKPNTPYSGNGSLYVESCKEKTYNIK